MHSLNDAAEWLRVTLSCIGETASSPPTRTARSRASALVAQALTGGTQGQTVDRSLTCVFHIFHQQTRTEVKNPVPRNLGTTRSSAWATITFSLPKTRQNATPAGAAPNSRSLGPVLPQFELLVTF